MDIDKLVDARCSVRRFHKKKPDYRDIIEAIDAGRKAPLAGNISCVKFILIDDPEIIADLAQASQQKFVAEVHYVVAVCSDKTDIIRSYYERGERYAKQQAGAAIENFLLKLTDLKLGTCWVGAFIDEQVKRAIRVPANVDVEAIFPIGYPLLKEKQKKKPDLDRCLFFNLYGNRTIRPRIQVEAR